MAASLELGAGADINAYTAGVNAYLREGRTLPPEYHVLRVRQVREWAPLDTACFLKVLRTYLSSISFLSLSLFVPSLLPFLRIQCMLV